SPFCDDLLPDWYDDWLVIERERFHQLRLRTLELICDRMTASGQFARALDVGLAAVAGEPLRESAHRALVKVHLAEGNPAEARRQFDLYRRLLNEQLGLAPSPKIVELLSEACGTRDAPLTDVVHARQSERPAGGKNRGHDHPALDRG